MRCHGGAGKIAGLTTLEREKLIDKFAETVNVQMDQEDDLGVGSSHIFEIRKKLFDVIAALDRHENLATHRFFLRMTIIK
jgi:hypothetical protein